ncbi:sugar transferase [Microbacterium sp. JZ70]
MTVLERALVLVPSSRLVSPSRASREAAPGIRTPRVAPSLERRRRLERRHTARVLLSDAGVVALAALVAGAVSSTGPSTATTLAARGALAPSSAVVAPALPVLFAVALGLFWWVGLAIAAPRSVHDTRGRELARVAAVTLDVFGLLGLGLVVTGAPAICAQLFVAAPIGLAGLLAARTIWRRRLTAERAAGLRVSRALVTGRPSDVARVSSTITGSDASGYRVVGAVEFDEAPRTQAAAMHIAQEAARRDADAVIVASTAASDADFVKRLGWCLEGTAAELIVANGVMDVARARMSLDAVGGLPLVRLRMPEYDGGALVLKRAFDIVVSTVALAGIALITPVIALAIALDSPGPVFFTQERVGRDGRTFRLVKFRSMRTTAEAELAQLRAQNEGAGPLFKLRRDPRVTRVGRFLRHYSLDELPQFWNVLVGDMSVVGPRPPLPSEVLAYDDATVRRLYVKPGITGPWQIGGRSDLSWQESVRIDLGYVENWSLQDDISIMWRTVRVMVRPKGAY